MSALPSGNCEITLPTFVESFLRLGSDLGFVEIEKHVAFEFHCDGLFCFLDLKLLARGFLHLQLLALQLQLLLLQLELLSLQL